MAEEQLAPSSATNATTKDKEDTEKEKP
ncbi:uncharacterized protein G2W53_018990 [Senna tora]|uniref:Uncharacterized protein n=1 Tax=Senna tora TaxID=362788 RepID=A0A834WQA7_9FABA|nr:uncharacterized protein G2W53_018990 [Senna tora]